MNCLAFLLSLTTSVYSAVDISSDHTGNVFMDNEPVSFFLRSSGETIISVKGYDGKTVLDKKIPSGESKVEMGILPRDFYTITIKSGDEEKEAFFAVIASKDSRASIEDSNIASDLATSWLVKPEQFDDLAKLTDMAGIIWIRDRMRWSEIEPDRGKWQERTRYDNSAEAQVKHDLKVYQVFHDTPRWAKEDGSSKSMPDDLWDVYNFAVETAKRFKGKVAAWEVWNEPDIIHFSDELGDSYAAMLKAMYLGFKSADPELPVLICSFAMGPGNFAETIFQNDVGNYFDIYNYHIYGKWEEHPVRASKHIELMKRYGVEDKPIWLTEAGYAVRRLEELVELTPEQGKEVAEFVPKAIVESLASGVDKYFWFILPYYRENDFMLFGLLRMDMTPTAGYCALAGCTYALGKGEYLGSLGVDDIHAYAFQRDDNNIGIAFWTNEGEKPLKLNVSAKEAKLVNLMGSEEEIKAKDGFLELEAGPSVKYVILPSDSIKDSLKVDNPRPEHEIKPYNPENVSPFVLRFQFPRDSRDKKSDTYMLPANSATTVSIEIYNFGMDKGSFKLEVNPPCGWNADLDNGLVEIGHKGRITREMKLSSGATSDPGMIRVNLLDASGKFETFITARIAVK